MKVPGGCHMTFQKPCSLSVFFFFFFFFLQYCVSPCHWSIKSTCLWPFTQHYQVSFFSFLYLFSILPVRKEYMHISRWLDTFAYSIQYYLHIFFPVSIYNLVFLSVFQWYHNTEFCTTSTFGVVCTTLRLHRLN